MPGPAAAPSPVPHFWHRPKPAPPPYSRTVGEHVRKALELLEARWEAEGRSLEDLGRPEDLAGRMLALIPEPSPWDDMLGPVYTTSAAARILGNITRQAMADRRRRRTVLALRTADGEFVYPAFQFTSAGQVLPGLVDVMGEFWRQGVDEWTVAGWLTARQDQLDGQSVVGWLSAGGDPAGARVVARAAASRMAE